MNAAAVFEVGYNETILPLVVATICQLLFSRNLHKIMLNTRHPYMVNDKAFRMHV